MGTRQFGTPLTCAQDALSADPTLQDLRCKIDGIDDQIVTLLGQRFDVCREVASWKAVHAMPVMAEGRVQAVKQRCAAIGQLHGLDPGFVEALYQMIIDAVCVMEERLIDASLCGPASAQNAMGEPGADAVKPRKPGPGA